jgi:ribosome-associated protein
VDAVSDKQAEDVLLLDIRNVASFADYFVIASGTANRQIQAIIEAVEQAVKAEGVTLLGREGKADSGWVLMDYGDVIVHIFAPEEREFYDLEWLWHTATPVVRIQ